jgi:tetratricopeptide (TPR) repeat protein
MARASAKGGGRPRPNARKGGRAQQVARPAQQQEKRHASYEDQLFFTKLRRKAKWIFVLLALAFAIGFLAFGVGAGGTGIGDVVRDIFGSGSDNPTVAEALDDVEDNPDDPDALRALATAYGVAQQYGNESETLERYLKLRPNEEDALSQLARSYQQQALLLRQRAQGLQIQSISSFTADAFSFPDTSGFLGALGEFPTDSAVTNNALVHANDLSNQAQQVFGKQATVYERLAKIRPDDPNLQLQLGAAASQAADAELAIAAYERFLELAPDDARAADVQRAIDDLRGVSDTATG